MCLTVFVFLSLMYVYVHVCVSLCLCIYVSVSVCVSVHAYVMFITNIIIILHVGDTSVLFNLLNQLSESGCHGDILNWDSQGSVSSFVNSLLVF